MGGVPTKHHSKSKVGRRRSQLALKKMRIVVCPKCKAPALPHRACPNCGEYVKVTKKKTETKS
ncbi:MAG: 50S ribosomal protein L32 [Minisyncoccia bacterium]